MQTNADLTLYNKYIDPTTRAEKYQRTQIQDVTWENRKAANVLASGGNINADQATIYIPLTRGADFLPPRSWQALVSKTGKWTLQTGDFIVRGLVEDEITEAITDPETEEVTPAFTMSDLKAKYDDVLAISSVDAMDEGSASMRHWQVGAK